MNTFYIMYLVLYQILCFSKANHNFTFDEVKLDNKLGRGYGATLTPVHGMSSMLVLSVFNQIIT